LAGDDNIVEVEVLVVTGGEGASVIDVHSDLLVKITWGGQAGKNSAT
jgi:hypothetical protein